MIKVYITAGGTRTEYTRYVTQVQIQDSINVPTLCTLNVANRDWLFQTPLQGSYAQIWSEKYQQYYFTGYITSVPELQPLGVTSMAVSGVMWNYVLRCTSEEYLLNNKAVPFIPPFIGLTQGKIISQLADILAPGLLDTTSYVASGDIVPYYQYNPNQSWSQIVKQFADQSFYRYKVINRTLYYQPYGDKSLGVSYDDTGVKETGFNPYQLSCQPLDNPIINHALVIGATEGGNYVIDYFMGDGFTGSFPLTEQAFRTDTNLLLDEEWSGSDINTQNWTVKDPQGDFRVFQGALNIIGGAGLDQSYLLMNNGVELGGTWYFQHESCLFTSASNGIIGGLYSSEPFTLENCILGLLCTPNSDGSMSISPIVNGVTGNNVTPVTVSPDYLHSYELATQVVASKLYRYIPKWSTTSTVYGGTEVTSGATVTFFIWDANPDFPLNPTLVSWMFTVDSIPAFAQYVPFNSIDLNVSVTQLQVIQPPQAGLYETPYFGTPEQFGRLTDLVQSQVEVEAASADGGLVAYSKAQRTVPYENQVWEAVGPTAWQYMTILQPSYLFSLPGQQQQVGMPQISHVSVIYPPYLLPPLPGQSIAVSVPGVSGASFDLTKKLSWLLAQQDISAVSYGFSGTIAADTAGVNMSGVGTAMLFDVSETEYTGGISGGILDQPPASSLLTQVSTPFVSVAQNGTNLTGGYGNLPSDDANWRLEVFSATDTFYYQGAATKDSSTGTWTFNNPASGSIVVFIISTVEPEPVVGGAVANPGADSIADSNSLPSSPKLQDYTVDFYSATNGVLTLIQDNVPMVVNVDGTLSAVGNVKAGSGTPVYQIIYTDPATSATGVVYDSRLRLPIYQGMVASYKVPTSDPAFVPVDQTALGAYAVQNRSNTKDNALAILAFLQNPNNLSPYQPSTGQSTSSQEQAQECAQLMAGLIASPQFLITDVRATASGNWSQTGNGTIVDGWDSTAPVNGASVTEFNPSGTATWSFQTGVPWACTGNLIKWTQKVQASDTEWYFDVELETDSGETVDVKFVAGSGSPSISGTVLTVPYSYPDNRWAVEQFDLAYLWASYGDQTKGLFKYAQKVTIQASLTFLLFDLQNGSANTIGALSKSYDMLNGMVDEAYIRTVDNAWMAYALSYYQQVTADNSVQNSLQSELTFLASLQWPASGDIRYNLLTAGYDGYVQSRSGGGGGVLMQSASGYIGTGFGLTPYPDTADKLPQCPITYNVSLTATVGSNVFTTTEHLLTDWPNNMLVGGHIQGFNSGAIYTIESYTDSSITVDKNVTATDFWTLVTSLANQVSAQINGVKDGDTILVMTGLAPEDGNFQPVITSVQITDSAGNTYTQKKNTASPDNYNQSQVWVASNVKGGDIKIVATISPSALDNSNNNFYDAFIFAYEISGDLTVKDISSYGFNPGTVAAGSPVSPPSISASKGDLLVSLWFDLGTSSIPQQITVGDGYTIYTSIVNWITDNENAFVAYMTATETGSASVIWTPSKEPFQTVVFLLVLGS